MKLKEGNSEATKNSIKVLCRKKSYSKKDFTFEFDILNNLY